MQKEITDQRKINRKKVFDCIYCSQNSPTKKELSGALGFSLPTLTQNINELIKKDVVVEKKSREFTGGRHAAVYEINQTAFYSIGISINDTNMSFVASDLRYSEIAYKQITYKVKSFKNEVSLLIADELDKFLYENKLRADKVLGVGIALPALFDNTKEKIVFAPTLKIKNLAISEITKCLKFPVSVENDGTAGGFCEYITRGQADNMAYISLENGVGGAIIIAGSPYHGDNIKSAEFGHTKVVTGGIKCSCGKRGCLEAYCSAKRFSENLGITLDEFFDEIKKGNKEYKKLWKEMLKTLSIGIVNIRTILDCQVVLGGFMAPYIEPYLDKLKENILEEDETADYISICKSGNSSVSLGVSIKFTVDFLENI